METTGQSEKLDAPLAHEEQEPDEQTVLPSVEQEQVEEEVSSPSPESVADTEKPVVPGKKRKKRIDQVDVQKISPRPSYWPIVLAFSLCMTFVGLAYQPIVLGIGALLIVVAIVGWGLERR